MNKHNIPIGLIIKAEVTIKEKDTDKVVYNRATNYKDGMIKLPDNIDLDEDKDYVGWVSVTRSAGECSCNVDSVIEREEMVLNKKK